MIVTLAAMRVAEEFYRSRVGAKIFRKEFTDSREGAMPSSGAVFLHGLGDHGGRHFRVLRRFVERGMYCVTVDLPGHGRTPGHRGYVPSLDVVYALVAENIERIRDRLGFDAPVGLLGHSMGGFIALNYLSRFPDDCQFSWISSPLINAAWKKPLWLRGAARIMSVVAPRFSIPSGVSSAQCKSDPARIQETKGDQLVHRRLTMRLGKSLLDASAALPDAVMSMNPDLRLLVTHGSEDRICPMELSRQLLERIPVRDKRFAELDGLLHEPFNDLGRDAFYQVLEAWLDELAAVIGGRPQKQAAA